MATRDRENIDEYDELGEIGEGSQVDYGPLPPGTDLGAIKYGYLLGSAVTVLGVIMTASSNFYFGPPPAIELLGMGFGLLGAGYAVVFRPFRNLFADVYEQANNGHLAGIFLILGVSIVHLGLLFRITQAPVSPITTFGWFIILLGLTWGVALNPVRARMN